MRHLKGLPAIILLAAGCTMATGKGPEKENAAKTPLVKATGPGFAVIELFTSEGCSSCPPADKLLGELSEEYPGKVYAMGFHVDYWDRQGWKDRFSSPDYTARQQHYEPLLKQRSAYTPQAVVNGTSEVVGSNKNVLESIIQKDLQATPALSLEAKAVSAENGQWDIRYRVQVTGANSEATATEFKGAYQLNAALVQKKAQSSVSAGENKGNTLSHINVVRTFQSSDIAPSGKGEITIKLPDDLPKDQARLFLYAQDTGNGQILSAIEVSLQ